MSPKKANNTFPKDTNLTVSRHILAACDATILGVRPSTSSDVTTQIAWKPGSLLQLLKLGYCNSDPLRLIFDEKKFRVIGQNVLVLW